MLTATRALMLLDTLNMKENFMIIVRFSIIYDLNCISDNSRLLSTFIWTKRSWFWYWIGNVINRKLTLIATLHVTGAIVNELRNRHPRLLFLFVYYRCSRLLFIFISSDFFFTISRDILFMSLYLVYLFY